MGRLGQPDHQRGPTGGARCVRPAPRPLHRGLSIAEPEQVERKADRHRPNDRVPADHDDVSRLQGHDGKAAKEQAHLIGQSWLQSEQSPRVIPRIVVWKTYPL
jgi:hypothetical protein